MQRFGKCFVRPFDHLKIWFQKRYLFDKWRNDSSVATRSRQKISICEKTQHYPLEFWICYSIEKWCTSDSFAAGIDGAGSVGGNGDGACRNVVVRTRLNEFVTIRLYKNIMIVTVNSVEKKKSKSFMWCKKDSAENSSAREQQIPPANLRFMSLISKFSFDLIIWFAATNIWFEVNGTTDIILKLNDSFQQRLS